MLLGDQKKASNQQTKTPKSKRFVGPKEPFVAISLTAIAVTDECAHAKNTQKPRINADTSKQFQYTIAELISLRSSRASMTSMLIDEVAYNDTSSKATAEMCFRQGGTGKGVRSHCVDLDAPIASIVLCYNLSRETDFASVQSMCLHRTGIRPVTVRMERRHFPNKAYVVFCSPEEARRFVSLMPTNAKIKGRIAKFALMDRGGCHSRHDSNADIIECKAFSVDERS